MVAQPLRHRIFLGARRFDRADARRPVLLGGTRGRRRVSYSFVPPVEAGAWRAALGFTGDGQLFQPVGNGRFAGIPVAGGSGNRLGADRKSTRLNSSHLVISYAVFCLKKKKKNNV